MIAPVSIAVAPTDRKAASAATAAAARVATRFEALVMGEMLKSMRAAKLDDAAFDSDSEGHWTELRDQQFAQMLAERAPLGLAAKLESAPK